MPARPRTRAAIPVYLAVPSVSHRPVVDYPPTQVHVSRASGFEIGKPVAVAALVREIATVEVDTGVGYDTGQMTSR